MPRALPFPACSKVVRKGIARVLTVVNQKTREALKESYKGKVRAQAVGRGAVCLLLLLLFTVLCCTVACFCVGRFGVAT